MPLAKIALNFQSNIPLLSKPIYKIKFASQITGIKASTIRAWLYGYKYNSYGQERFFAPLLIPYPKEQLPNPGQLMIGFDSLIELMYVNELIAIGRNNNQNNAVDRVRQLISLLQEEFCSDRPLLHPASYGIFNHQFHEKLITTVGNLSEFKTRIVHLRSRIYWQAEQLPVKIFMQGEGRYISLALGQTELIIDQANITIDQVVKQFRQGKPLEDIRLEYKLSQQALEAILRLKLN